VGQATGLFVYIRNLWFIYRPAVTASPAGADQP
jgi:hypothetical protein